MSFDLAQLQKAVAQHGRVGRIVIAGHAGSAPRETGTSMLVWAKGQEGTIGGGALEFETVERLRKRLSQSAPRVERLPLGPALGQCCGGAVTLVSEVFDAEALDGVTSDQGLYIRRCEGFLAEPLSMTRLRAQARNGAEPAGALFAQGWLAEPLSAQKHPLWVWGAGHVGRALIGALAPLPELDITWVDTARARYPDTPARGVRLLPVPNPAAAVTLAPKDAHHLVLTYAHSLDLDLCHQLLRHGFRSAGLIGSATKWARFQSRLAALGHSPAEIAAITCPIGEPALGKHPQAIALGVARALIMSLRAEEDRRARGGRNERAAEA
jgi:xanthine dehydrogenase accessory factor